MDAQVIWEKVCVNILLCKSIIDFSFGITLSRLEDLQTDEKHKANEDKNVITCSIRQESRKCLSVEEIGSI